MFTSRIPVHEIDLSLPETSRWSNVIRVERVMLRRVALAAMREFQWAPEWGRWAAGKAFEAAYRLSGGLYRGELAELARAAGVSLGELSLGNAMYELSHALEWLHARGRQLTSFGCTAGVRRLADG